MLPNLLKRNRDKPKSALVADGHPAHSRLTSGHNRWAPKVFGIVCDEAAASEFVFSDLATWPDSTLCLSTEAAAGSASDGNADKHVPHFRFDPFSADTHRYNPLRSLPSCDTATRSAELESIARLFWPLPAKEQLDHHRVLAAELFQASAMYMLEGGDTPTFGQVRKVGNLFVKFEAVGIERFAEVRRQEGHVISPRTQRLLTNFCALPVAIREVVLTRFNEGLALFADDLAAYAVSGDDDFVLHETWSEPQSVFLCAPEEHWVNAVPLFKLMVMQTLRARLRSDGDAHRRTPHLLLVLNRFTSLGRFDCLLRELPSLKRCGVSVLMIYPSQEALRAVYGEAAARQLTEACDCRALLFPESDEVIVAPKGKKSFSVRRNAFVTNNIF